MSTQDGIQAREFARVGQQKELAMLLESKTKNDWINTAAGNNGRTPLLESCLSGKLEAVKLLLKHEANINYPDSFYGGTPILYASKNGHLEVVKCLFENGADISIVTKTGYTALHEACRSGHKLVVEFLLDKGAEIESFTNDGRTPLHFASIGGQSDVAKILLNKGADIKKQDKENRTCIDTAIDGNFTDLVMVYYHHLDKEKISLQEGETVLHRVCRKQKNNMAIQLAENGADPTVENDSKKVPGDYLFDEGVKAKLLEIKLSRAETNESGTNNTREANKKKAETKKADKKKQETKATALNDGAKGGVDRFNYTSYAQSLVNVLKDASLPVCVGLYAKWGSGKSFMIQLLKRHMDSSALENRRTKDVCQWFEPSYKATYRKKTEERSLLTCWTQFWWKIWNGLCVLRSLVVPYTVSTIVSIFNDMFRDLVGGFFFSSGYQYLPAEEEDVEKGPSLKTPRIHPTGGQQEDNHGFRSDGTEYVFVDYNAWEFASTDELWAGLIRNLYTKMELRLSMHPHHPLSRSNVDYKRKWRTQKAKKELENRYGGKGGLRLKLIALMVMLCSILMLIVASALKGFTFLIQLVQNVNEVVVVVIAFVASVYPAVQLLRGAAKDSGTSRGDVLYAEAGSIHDRTGFMSKVRSELDELFEFMLEYKEESGFDLKLVLFVDDLDRCLEGRNVKVLEALQLVLAVDNAPVIAFLAIDSTVLVSSIEMALNRSLSTSDALITGWEYLDKIVQLPFCLPEAPPEKVERLVVSCLNKKPPSVGDVAERLKRLLQYASEVEDGSNASPSPFLLRHKESEKEEEVPFFSLDEFLSEMLATRENCQKKSFDEFEDLALVMLAGELLNEDCINAVEQVMQGVSEGEELLCEQVSLVLQRVDEPDGNSNKAVPIPIQTGERCNRPFANKILADQNQHKSPEVTNENNHSKRMESKRLLFCNLMKRDDPDDAKGKPPLSKNRKAVLYCKKIKQEDVALSAISAPMNEALRRFSRFSDPNPRRLKRIVNVIQIVSEVGRLKPISPDKPSEKLFHLDQWALFSRKLVKWIYLCENYPYRMSFLALFLTHWNRKKVFNEVMKDKQKSRFLYEAFAVDHKTESSNASNKSSTDIELDENEDLLIFYLRHVESYVHCIPNASRLLRLDGDPELLAIMLNVCVDEESDITVQDVLGPFSDTKGERDSNFSLLSYSFNLHPAMRRIIGSDMATLTSPHELCFYPEDSTPRSLGTKKMSIVSKCQYFTGV